MTQGGASGTIELNESFLRVYTEGAPILVVPASRGRGVAPALVCTVAAEILQRGRTYVKGQAGDNRTVQRLYARFAMGFPGADYIVGGRAFRRLAELAGRSARVVARSLPEKSWNYEP
jgi:hypothetical protein